MMDWDILYASYINKPKIFQELATQAHDMEFTITYYGRRLNDDESVASLRNENSMLRDSEEKECPYSEFDVPEMLNKLLEKGLIELLESSRSEEIKRTNDPKYCKYHRIISHLIEKCKTFRGYVLQLIKEGKIILNEDDIEEYD